MTDKIQVIDTPDGKLPITEHLFDGDALVLEDNQLGLVEIISEKSDKPLVSVMFTSPLVGLWSPPHKNAPFVCIEPWYGIHDKVEYNGEFKDKYLMNHLQPGASFMAQYSIKIG